MTAGLPLIGITSYGPEGELDSLSLPSAYLRAVAASGGLPVLVGPCGLAAEALLDRLDGLLLSGGGDLGPECHAGGTHEAVYGVVPERDVFEIDLARRALERRDLPVLGICRGTQTLNVALGGDLELHLPDAHGESVAHRLPPREPTTHPVRVDAASALGRIYRTAEFPVCSWHHQGVRALGRGLEAVAWAPDSVIEAIESREHRFAIGVQWHPEMQVDEEPLQRRIFEALVEEARS